MNVLSKRDSEKTLDSSVKQFEQTTMDVPIVNSEHDERTIDRVIFVGMGGSALAADLVKIWLDDKLRVPVELVKGYTLPGSVNESSLVILSSCSGNTEEVLEALEAAKACGAQLAIVAAGGKLAELANAEGISHIIIPPIHIQPRMLTFVQVRALVALLGLFGVIEASGPMAEMASVHDWLAAETAAWAKEVPTGTNYAKQLALIAVGKTPVFYGGHLTRSIAYKWKISWNENAKNTAFWNEYPEFNHNEFIGWSSHPVEKPFAIFDLISQLEHPRILKRFEISDRLLSGKRPKANQVVLQGDTLLQQMLWGHVLADYASIYVGILNNVDPGPVLLVTKLKQELENI